MLGCLLAYTNLALAALEQLRGLQENNLPEINLG